MSARDVIANLRALAARTSDVNGAQRVAWGPVWRNARHWLDGLLADEGLRAEADAAEWARLPCLLANFLRVRQLSWQTRGFMLRQRLG